MEWFQCSPRWVQAAAIASTVTLMGWLSPLAAQSATPPSVIERAGITTSEPGAEPRLRDRSCPEHLPSALTSITHRSQFRSANWGIMVYSLQEEALLHAHNADRLLIPASNIKLFTTAAAMRSIMEHSPDRLGEFQDVLTVVNRNSNNARADELLRGIGGQSRVKLLLEPIGVDPNSYIQADGSGLSRRNQVQPAALVALLKGMHATDETGLFYQSLPVGGVNGTLRNRFKDTPAYGKVHAKTGTLNGVRALSGYLETDGYGTVIFSIVINQAGQSGGVMLAAIDEMVLTINQLERCE
ncbi:MAG: D-alanyl-D-alanine carboxypeptidase [Leptolyngbyaceae cyanobacterium]